MIKQDQVQQLMDGGSVVGRDGDSIGKIGQVFLDNETGDVSWVTVKTGWFGSGEAFVPTDEATVSGDTVTVPYDKDTIKGAPHHDSDAELSEADENELYAYYGVGDTATASSAQRTDAGYAAPAQTVATTTTTEDAARTATATTGQRADTVAETAAPRAAKTDDGYMTRSEERLHVGTQRVEAGRARLRKYVVTEQQTVTVPVSHEEVHVVREPIAPGEPLDGASIGEDSIEVTLTAERAVVTKEVVGVERIRLDTTTVTEQQQVTESVRKEQIEMSGGEVAGTARTAQTTGTARTEDSAATAGESLKDKIVDKAHDVLGSDER